MKTIKCLALTGLLLYSFSGFAQVYKTSAPLLQTINANYTKAAAQNKLMMNYYEKN